MNFLDSFLIQKRLMTADEVLSALQQRLDHIWRLCKKPSVLLTRNYLIRDWVHLPQGSGWLDFASEWTFQFWDDVADGLIEQFAIDLPDNVLASFLKRPRGTLGDLCDLIAQHAELEIIPDIRLTNKSCQSAGLFLALRERLKRFTGQQWDIAPSSTLLLRREEMLVLCDSLSVLAPNRITYPQPVQTTPKIAWLLRRANETLWASIATCAVALVLLIVTLNELFMSISSVAFLMFLICAVGLVTYSLRHDRWHWVGITTYRDLMRQLSK